MYETVLDEIKHNMILVWFLHSMGCLISAGTLYAYPNVDLVWKVLNGGALAFNAGAIIFWTVWYIRIRAKFKRLGMI